MLHITLVTFRSDVDEVDTRASLSALSRRCSEVTVLAPHDAEAKRSWDACIEVRGDVEATLASTPWATLYALLQESSEVHKSWTFKA